MLTKARTYDKFDVAIVDERKLEIDIFFDKKLSVLTEIDKRIESSSKRDKVGWVVKKIFVAIYTNMNNKNSEKVKYEI